MYRSLRRLPGQSTRLISSRVQPCACAVDRPNARLISNLMCIPVRLRRAWAVMMLAHIVRPDGFRAASASAAITSSANGCGTTNRCRSQVLVTIMVWAVCVLKTFVCVSGTSSSFALASSLPSHSTSVTAAVSVTVDNAINLLINIADQQVEGAVLVICPWAGCSASCWGDARTVV